jgi:hypothetical protein
VLELELAVVLLCKEVLAAVDGIYEEDLVCSIFMFRSRLDQFETTRAFILSSIEALVPHCPVIHISSSTAVRTLTHPGGTCQDKLD